jgi:hypothetical protein
MLTALSARRLCFDNPQLTIMSPSFSAEKPMIEYLMLLNCLPWLRLHADQFLRQTLQHASKARAQQRNLQLESCGHRNAECGLAE